ncbi:capsular biosynthesis protein [Clostridium gasigenes]|uniref:tyrosine-protein phosphatase n=1 Tax=Clostridium gasigenes TaxID=94869 RepID=UPI001C0CAFDC|nr:CpsB/CapC family capsule biosynthesis tyrosine phosphatase [Clostridium gasigenes]MBU3138166.1 capsular biosynthesis protein [Clostridium gasigenes]
MVDLHSHIIWNIDDGSKSKDMTLNMLKIAKANGTTKIVATPHFYRGVWEASSAEVRERLEDVKTLAKENNINIEIYSGQEVYYSENIIDHYNEGFISTINDSRYMLIELPIKEFKISEVVDNIYELQLKGLVPILAHPERYIPFIKNPILINKFIKEGFLFQLNSGSLVGYFGKDVKKTAEMFLENKLYSFIGSDGHRDEKRDTNLTDGITAIRKINSDYVDIFKENGQAAIENKEISFMGITIKEKKKGFLGKIFG